MKFWTTDHISDENKVFMLFEEDPNPRVGHNKDMFLAQIFYHNHTKRGEDVGDISYTVNFSFSRKQPGTVKEFSTLEDAKEYVYDVLDIDDDEDIVNSDFDLDFEKPYIHRGYYRPHELGLP